MAYNTFPEHDDQFIVSYELLYILQWLITYEKQALAELINKAVAQGSHIPHAENQRNKAEENELLQNSVIDFFTFLENQVANASQEQSMQQIIQSNLLKTLDHIDPNSFEASIIRASMVATAEKLQGKENLPAKDYFLKQLLKKWSPKKEKNKKHNLH